MSRGKRLGIFFPISLSRSSIAVVFWTSLANNLWTVSLLHLKCFCLKMLDCFANTKLHLHTLNKHIKLFLCRPPPAVIFSWDLCTYFFLALSYCPSFSVLLLYLSNLCLPFTVFLFCLSLLYLTLFLLPLLSLFYSLSFIEFSVYLPLSHSDSL